MIVYPAIDLRSGKVVRLREGDPAQLTTFSDDPLATARSWVAQGAEWIHMVNLDGAFAESNDNERTLAAASQLDVKIQFGGGLRSLSDIARALEQGATRVVLGTLAVNNPDLVTEAIEHFGKEAICVALDARDGKITTHGWQRATPWTVAEFGKVMRHRGVMHVLYTDVVRDGKLTGVDVAGTVSLAQETGLSVIASGGVRDLDDLTALTQTGAVDGVIIGMALYENRFTLQQAFEITGDHHAG